jgi:hypothetical protein
MPESMEAKPNGDYRVPPTLSPKPRKDRAPSAVIVSAKMAIKGWATGRTRIAYPILTIIRVQILRKPYSSE